MNKSHNQMYPWVDKKTRNLVGDECQHFCSYCYMKKGVFRLLKKYQGTARLIEKELVNLGEGKIIFIGSATDMWGEWVDSNIISAVLKHLCKHDNTYLLQTKNPHRYHEFLTRLPPKVILGTTLETNDEILISNVSQAPAVYDRVSNMVRIKGFKKMVSIEPVMNMDIAVMLGYIKDINPEFVSVGADSKKCKLEEPDAEKLRNLIDALPYFAKEIKLKPNLQRLLTKGEQNG